MYVRDEFHRNAHGLPELLLYFAELEDGIVQLYDGALLATWRYAGPDLDSLSPGEASNRAKQVAKTLSLGSGWLIETNAIRQDVREYLPKHPPTHPVAALLDHERREQFLTPNWGFRSQYYLTLTYLPPSLATQRADAWLSGQSHSLNPAELAQRRLALFREAIRQFETDLARQFTLQRLRRTTEDDLPLRFLRNCVLAEDYRFAPPAKPVYLNLRFPGSFTPGLRPQLNGRELRVVAIDTYPVSTDPNTPAGSYPAMLRGLETLPFACRWSMRSALLNPEDSNKMWAKHERAWKGRRLGLGKQFTGFGSSKQDKIASDLAADADKAATLARYGDTQFGQFNCKIILAHEDPEMLDAQTDAVNDVFRRAGFTHRIERENAVDAWRGSLPGHAYSDYRVVPVHTENFAHMMPQGTVYTGAETNPSEHMQGAPPLMLTATDGNTPYRFHLYGHAFVHGPTRHGKSTLLALIAMQHIARYPKAQLFAFDKHFSIRPTIQALGGPYYEPGRDDLKFCPLEHLETEMDRAWACDFIRLLCEINRCEVPPELVNAISTTVQEMAGGRRRSLSEFRARCRNPKLQTALRYWTVESASGGAILDGEVDGLSLSDARAVGFELEHLYTQSDKRILKAIIPHLAHLITGRLDTRIPTLILFDECWVAMQEPFLVDQIRSWLKELLKRNAQLLLSAQDMQDVWASDLKNVIVNQCHTMIHLPAASASTTERPYYEDLHLSPERIRMIAEGVAKRDYFHHVHDRNIFRPFQIHPGQVALSFIGVNSDRDHDELARLRKIYPEGQWQVQWLRHRGLSEWADALAELVADSAQPNLPLFERSEATYA